MSQPDNRFDLLLAAHPTVANLSPNGREAEGMGGTHAWVRQGPLPGGLWKPGGFQRPLGLGNADLSVENPPKQDLRSAKEREEAATVPAYYTQGRVSPWI